MSACRSSLSSHIAPVWERSLSSPCLIQPAVRAVARMRVGFSQVGWLVVTLSLLGLNDAQAAKPFVSPIFPVSPSPAAQDQSIDELIRQLDSDKFGIRELATRELIDVGEAAIEPVHQAILGGTREIRSRGLFVLKEIAIEESIDGPTPARDALERLRDDGSNFVQRQAQTVLNRLNEIREAKTLAYLQELGAVKSDGAVVAGQFANRTGGYVLLLNDGWKGDLSDLHRMTYLQQLVGISLTGEWVNDEVVEALTEIKQLRLVSIRKGKITDRTPALLAGLENLIGFELRYCNVTDQSLQDMRRFQFLSKLILIGTKITPAVASELEDLFGTTVVDYRRGGFLGVSCYTENQQCVVMRVVEDSGADKLGISVRDVITHVNEKPVQSSEELIEAIADHEIGSEIEVTWLENGKTKKGKVALGEYQDLD